MEGYEPRPKASQAVAAKRIADDIANSAIRSTDAPAASPRTTIPLAIAAGIIIIAMLIAATYQLSQSVKPLSIPPQPRSAPTAAPSLLFTAPTATQPTLEPTTAPTAPQAVTATETQEQIGRGATIEDQPAEVIGYPRERVMSYETPIEIVTAPDESAPDAEPAARQIVIVQRIDNAGRQTITGSGACAVARGNRRCGK